MYNNIKELECLLLYVVEEVDEKTNQTKVFAITPTIKNAKEIQDNLILGDDKKFIIKQQPLKNIRFLD